jgi:pyruvate/2-oxoglutarate dehydrogenase complex dihydrolipoamide acyltransferase (E2) component
LLEEIIRIPEELWSRRGGWSGKVINVFKKPGDRVSKGEPIAEVEIEKAVLVIESPYSGIVKEILVSQGDSVYPGSGLVRVEVVGEG